MRRLVSSGRDNIFSHWSTILSKYLLWYWWYEIMKQFTVSPASSELPANNRVYGLFIDTSHQQECVNCTRNSSMMTDLKSRLTAITTIFKWTIQWIELMTLRARSHLATATQIFYVVSISSEMDCTVTNVTVHTWWQKNHIVVVKCEWTLKSNYHAFSVYLDVCINTSVISISNHLILVQQWDCNKFF